jgi:hypothetical protein
MGEGVEFVVPSGEVSANDRLHHIAIQAVAMMLKGWFEEAEPSPEEAQQMVEAVMKGLLGSRASLG